MSAISSSRVIRFSTFEVNLHTGELRQRGQKVKLQEQPLQLLAALLERPGELVTREELRGKLWPADTFVDFDHSLNAAIKRLRDALGESAERPIFVETVARRGYRFIGNVEIPAATPSVLSDFNGLKQDTETGRIPTRVGPTGASGRRARGWQFAGAVLAIVVMVSMAGGWFLWRQASRSKLSQASVTLRRLTTNAAENWVIASAISPDGKYLAYSDKTGAYFRLFSTGEVHPLLPKVSDVTFLGWFPDSSQLLASWAIPPAKKSLWAVSILGGNARQLSDEGWSASVSPDGSQIAFLKGAGFGETGQEIWLMRANGADQRKLMSFPEGGFALPVWSPDGRWIAYLKFKPGPNNYEVWIELFNLGQGTQTVVLSDPHLEAWGFIWLPDGRLVYAMDEPPPSQNSSNFWAARIDLSTGRLVGTPARITSGDGFAVKPSATADGKRLVFDRAKPQADIYISEFSAKGPRLSAPRRLTFDEGDDLPFDWTSDNKAVLFISDRTGTPNIFRQRIDATSTEMLVIDQEKKSPICRLTPDGSHILYSVRVNPSDNLGPVRLMRAPINGGPPHIVLEAPAIGNFECSHAPATICAFSQEEPKELVISVFDPVIGEPHKIATLEADWGWGLSPDGKAIAASTFGATKNRIRLLSLSGQPTRELMVKNWSGFTSIDWAADSKGLFVASNPAGLRQSLLYIDLAGNAHQIWQTNNVWPSWVVPSRNGKYVAIPALTADINVWMEENF
ncbi:MAG TPA: winged helix-turn-helix domain-containing protein [Candidatus Eisenbacteria bacterium]|nr:winged helix-turn-helix domain-containing protein [Candidatus Eisenbacteria bacterium]